MGGLLFLAAPLATSARAEPLTKEECAALRQQRQELETKGVGAYVNKGAKWASANLNAGQISEVGSFLKVLENIRFRCGNSLVDAKSKFGLHRAVPLPVRNSRRLNRIKAEKNKEKASLAISEKMAPETKSVISAVTSEPEKAPTGTGVPLTRPSAN